MQPHHPSPRTRAHPRTLRILLAVLYLVALSLLIVWEYHDRLDVLSSECDFRDQAKSTLYSRTYDRLLSWVSPETPAHVVTIALPADLEEIQKNLCLGRTYMADLLRVLAQQNPAVIAIDKFYSPNACATSPATTGELLAAVKGLSVPVVVGESTNGIEELVHGACLVRRPQLDFAAANVVHGLTRLNMEPERFPLRWRVLKEEPDHHGEAAVEPEFADSLVLAAIRAYDPGFTSQTKVQRLIDEDDHAYANLDFNLPRATSTDLLCSAHDAALTQRWSLDCSHARPLPRMLGKIVLVGSEDALDLKLVLGHKRWGFELQAVYMESLLSGDYLRWLPIGISFVLFAAFVFLIEGVPTILLAYRPRWKNKFLLHHAYKSRRYVWVVLWALILILVSAAFSLALRYLPPLLVYGDILFVTITRLVYFSAESAEHPLLHSHPTRKEHAMPSKLPPNGKLPSVDADGKTPSFPDQGSDADTPDKPVNAPTINKPGSEGGTAG